MAAPDDQTHFAIRQSDRPIFATFFDTLQLQYFSIEFGDLFRFPSTQRDVIQPARLLPSIGKVAFAHIGLAFLG